MAPSNDSTPCIGEKRCADHVKRSTKGCSRQGLTKRPSVRRELWDQNRAAEVQNLPPRSDARSVSHVRLIWRNPGGEPGRVLRLLAQNAFHADAVTGHGNG